MGARILASVLPLNGDSLPILSLQVFIQSPQLATIHYTEGWVPLQALLAELIQRPQELPLKQQPWL